MDLDIYLKDIPVCLTDLPINFTDLPINLKNLPIYLTDLPIFFVFSVRRMCPLHPQSCCRHKVGCPAQVVRSSPELAVQCGLGLPCLVTLPVEKWAYLQNVFRRLVSLAAVAES